MPRESSLQLHFQNLVLNAHHQKALPVAHGMQNSACHPEQLETIYKWDE